VNRSPLPAWRRLFAAGGAPAATHAVLSRAPSPERLLEPMARVRMAAESSLDALARPIDLSSVLSRVLEGVSGAPSNTGDAIETPMRTQNVAARAVDAMRPISRARQIDHGIPDTPAVRGKRPTPPSSRKSVTMNQPPRVEGSSRVPVALHETSLNSFDAPRTTATARTTVPFARRSASIDAGVGAKARVIVDGPVEGIDRLLAIGNPSTMGVQRARPAAQSNGPSMEPSSSDSARLLSSAVDRVTSRRLTSPAQASHGEHQRRAPVHTEMLNAEQDRTADNGGTHVADAPSNGGFRGLARRTLVANGGQQHIPVRLEPEVRAPSDLPLDTLDARLAESLARILEREARRHGVDVAESRT